MAELFVDTGAFIARYVSRDQFHAQASQLWLKAEREIQRFVTTSHVLNETITFLGRCAGNHFAAEKAQMIYAWNKLEIIRAEREGELKALRLFEKFSDQRVSFTDCLSFVVMKDLKVRQAFSFDQDFIWAGFSLFS